MDSRLYAYYETELGHIQSTAREFAREFPKIAGRLDLLSGEFPCADPYVERLLEGFAFLAARVQLKLDAGFPRFTQNLLESVLPHYLSPTPSMTIVQLQPDLSQESLFKGATIRRDTVLRSKPVSANQTPCEYRTAHQVRLWPLTLTGAKYYLRDLDLLDLKPPPGVKPARAAMHIRLSVAANKPASAIEGLDELTFFLRDAGGRSGRFLEQIIARCSAVAVRAVARPNKPAVWLPAGSVRSAGFSEGEALLPIDLRSFQGYRLLQEYFAMPQRFLFFRLGNLAPALKSTNASTFDLIFLFEREELALENSEFDERTVEDCLALNCTPAINLFAREAERVFVKDHFSEFPVHVDRTKPLDYEVYRVSAVHGYGDASTEPQVFRPFFAANDIDASRQGEQAFYAVHRVPRQLTETERRQNRMRRSYAGSDVYITLVDSKDAPYRTDLQQIGIECLCTNRDLPIDIVLGSGASDFEMDIDPAVRSARCIVRPTLPKPSHAEGDVAWRLISHLSLNYLSLIDSDHAEGAVALRDLLKLYGDPAIPEHREQIEGVRSVSVRSAVRSVPGGGAITFARGLEVSITLDDHAFAGTGVFVLASVLDQFFARYVTINSFVQTVLLTPDRGEIMRWNVHRGTRPMI